MNSELEIMEEKVSWLAQKCYIDILLVRTMEYKDETLI
jgi:hypothetical protein